MGVVTLPGDNGTWSVTIVTASDDQPLKRLRHAGRWTNAIRACPLHAHWLDGEPTTDVLAMGGVTDRYRRFVVDGRPVATGFLAVADAWACTNPSAGRGLTVGFKHAVLLRDVLRETRADPRTLAEEFDERTEAEIAPWYRAQLAVDRYRPPRSRRCARVASRRSPADELSWASSLFAAMTTDPDIFGPRSSTSEPSRRSRRSSGVPVAGANRAAMDMLKDSPPMPMPGPDRQRLLELVQ